MNRRLLAGGAIVAGLLAFSLVLPTLQLGDTAFSAYGSSEEDTSDLVGGLRVQGHEVRSLTLGPSGLEGLDPAETDVLYVSLGVDRGYTQPELDALWTFLEAGGRAVVLDDTGASGSLLDRLEVDRGSMLFSTTGDQPSVVRVTIGDQAVTLWEPTELAPREGSDVEVLARADNTTAKDTNQNNEIDAQEPTCQGGCAVALRQEVGEGRITVISDVTFATNRYASGTNVIQLFLDLATQDTQGRSSLIVVDESRHVVGAAEVGLTAFRSLVVPLGIPYVPWIVAGLTLVATGAAVARRGEGTWEPHDPRMDERYLDTEPGDDEPIEPETEPPGGEAP